MADQGAAIEQHFVHQQASHLLNVWFFYAFGNVPPTDLLQYISHDEARADILCLGCGDLRDLLYSLLLHGRRGVGGGPSPRPLSFTLNDWEPAVHARNLLLLQMFLDSRSLLEVGPPDAEGIGLGLDVLDVNAGQGEETGVPTKSGERNSKTTAEAGAPAGRAGSEAAFAQRIGVIFSAMYNLFVDADVLETIQEVAGRLAASAASAEEWASTELGRCVQFADDRSQDRVRDIFRQYADASLLKDVSAKKVKRDSVAFVVEAFQLLGGVLDGGMISSRSWGLASFGTPSQIEAYSKMRHRYVKDGALDPFPLLLDSPKRSASNLVNPLLLVTERKGLECCLHYGAFPLDAFHTDVAWWKLRKESLQDEYGKLAPAVIKYPDFHFLGCKEGSVSSATAQIGMQTAWFGAALEELAQMCGAFLEATAPTTPRLRITIHAGEALNFCDALVAASTPTRLAGSKVAPVMFQQYTLQPLQLRAEPLGLFTGSRPRFHVINTSNLADHLGIVNLLVGSTPLLSESSHAVILTSFIRESVLQKLYGSIDEFYETYLCMSSHAAAVLLGVVPVSSISALVDHLDTTAFVQQLSDSENKTGDSYLMRLTWKRPAQAFANNATVVSSSADTRLDISPGDFVHLTLPIYKAMFSYMLLVQQSAMMGQGKSDKLLAAMGAPKHYSPLSFARLLVSAGRQLRLSTTHFFAALNASMDHSGLIMASNFQQEQIGLFDALDLAPISESLKSAVASMPRDAMRVVLLVPRSALGLMHEFKLPEVYLSISSTEKVVNGFDNHFLSVHMAYVRVRRGSVERTDKGWQSLNSYLHVRDTKEKDPEAELMVSAVIPTFAVKVVSPSMMKLELRPRDSAETRNAPKAVKRRMAGGLCNKFYGALLSDNDRTALISPSVTRTSEKRTGSTRPLPCPPKVARDRNDEATSTLSQSGSQGVPVVQRTVNGEFLLDQSMELVSNNGRFVYRVKVRMANDKAKQLLAAEGMAPVVEETVDHCSVRVKLAGLTHVTRFPFPVNWKATHIKFSKKQGFFLLTVPPLGVRIQIPFSTERKGVDGGEKNAMTLPSSWCFPICPPLRSMPRLDLAADCSSHLMSKVFGAFSISKAELAAEGSDEGGATVGFHPGLLKLKKRLRWLAIEVCKQHDANRAVGDYPCICITEARKPALWVWVYNILLDSSNEALVLDCCFMPVDDTSDAASAKLSGAAESANRIGTKCPIFVEADRSEVELWTALLPVVVERARQTYAHSTDCAYSKLKTSSGGPTLCGCGKGKDLPRTFVESIESVTATGSDQPLHCFFYRAALSPLYNSPYAKFSVPATKVAEVSSVTSRGVCASCRKTGASMRCSRCRKLFYCSRECQRAHWKTHKTTCG